MTSPVVMADAAAVLAGPAHQAVGEILGIIAAGQQGLAEVDCLGQVVVHWPLGLAGVDLGEAVGV